MTEKFDKLIDLAQEAASHADSARRWHVNGYPKEKALVCLEMLHKTLQECDTLGQEIYKTL